MRGLKIIGLLFIILAIFLSYPVCQQLFAKNEKTGIRITAICDESKMSGTENKVYILKPGEYRQYIDDMLKITEMPVSGKTPLFLSALPGDEYYIGVEILYDTNVIKSEMISINGVMPLPEKYYIDDLYDGYGRGAHLSFGNDGKAEFKFYFVKWYRISVINGIQNVVALFLDKSGGYKTWEKYYPSEKSYHVVHNPEAMNNLWEQTSKIGTETTSKEKDQIVNLLERGGKTYFPRNNKPNVFFVDSEGRINFNGRLDFKEALEMQELFVDTNVLPASISISNSSKAQVLPPTLTADMKKKFSTFKHELVGSNEIRVYNPNDYSAYISIQKDDYGTNFLVSPQSTASVFVPDGRHDIYFVYSDKPEALFQGDSFTLNNNGIEIRLVKVIGGNFGIRRVK